MEIPIDEQWLKTLYDILINIYKDTDNPVYSALPLVPSYNANMISVCVKRPQNVVFGKKMYPHHLQKAAVLMHSIINFHPFTDGNKRTALISTAFYLHWNGYNFTIPEDADSFTIEVAKGNRNINEILLWLTKNSERNFNSVLNSFVCNGTNWVRENLPLLRELAEIFTVVFFIPDTPFIFFRRKIQHETKSSYS